MISAHEYKVIDILGDKFVHEIPPYQRPYTWGAEHSLQLLQDVIEAENANSGQPYFLGSIVRIHLPNEIPGQVVDGQQRLTTLTMLAATLRDIADDNQERDAISTVVYINPNPFKNQKEAVRVLQHSEDRQFFREAIQLPGATTRTTAPNAKTEAQKLMWSNVLLLRDRIRTMPRVERQRLVTFLLNECMLVLVETDSRGDALRIFKVLNDRGLDLSNADVIKADLLNKFGNQEEVIQQAGRWRLIENDPGRDDFEGLLESLRFIQEKWKNRRTLSDAYHENFVSTDAEGVRRFFEHELVPAKRWFAVIIDGDCSEFPVGHRSTATEALVGLSLVPNKDWMPAALAAALKLGETQALAVAWERLEGLAWILQLGRRYDTQRMNRYAEFIRMLDTETGSYLEVLKGTPDEEIDALQALKGPLYDRFPTRVVRAILERLDRLLSEQPIFWEGQKTVEHILPQDPERGTWTGFDETERLSIVHTLGNLVLLSVRKNSSASRLELDEKKKVYFGLGNTQATRKIATYASVQELAHISKWDRRAYDVRHVKHVSLLAERWGLKPTF